MKRLLLSYQGYHFFVHNLVIELAYGAYAILVKENKMEFGESNRDGDLGDELARIVVGGCGRVLEQLDIVNHAVAHVLGAKDEIAMVYAGT